MLLAALEYTKCTLLMAWGHERGQQNGALSHNQSSPEQCNMPSWRLASAAFRTAASSSGLKLQAPELLCS